MESYVWCNIYQNAFFASLGFTCRTNNRLIKSYSDGSFETTEYANELISNSILTFIFVFNHEETYVNFSDVRAITNIIKLRNIP